MTSIIDPALLYMLPEKATSSSSFSAESDSTPVDAVIFAGISLVLGTACRQLFNGTRVPYTVVLLVIGIALGSLEYGTHHNLGKIGHGIVCVLSYFFAFFVFMLLIVYIIHRGVLDKWFYWLALEF